MAGDWSSVRGIVTNLLDGNLLAIFLALIVTFSVPVLLHFLLYRSATSPAFASFTLLGPSGAGKTAFFLLLESKCYRSVKPARSTHTSQTTSISIISLPSTVPVGSNRYRSINDPSISEVSRNPIKYQIIDTPGHGKLRDTQAISQLRSNLYPENGKSNLRGIIFVVDAAVMSDSTESLRDAASYLHQVLLILQKRALSKKKSLRKAAAEVSVLVAANKQDLFTALPPGSVRDRLEAEIDRIRKSKSKGLLDADVSEVDDEEVLGGDNGYDAFSFKLLEQEVGIKVDVIGGAVKSGNEADTGTGVRRWEEWIGTCL